MTGYVVTIEVAGDGNTPLEPALTDEFVAERLDKLLDGLSHLHVSVSGDTRGWTAIVTVDADTPSEASDDAVAQIRESASILGLPTEPLARMELVREDVRDAELERPTLPDLVSGPEAADILGVTRQRLHQLASDHPDFPAPAYRLGVGMLWHRAAVERFAEMDRPRGRPKADRELASA